MAVVDDQIRETVSRLLDRIATEAAEHATAEAAREAEAQRAQLASEIEGLQQRLDETREDSQRRIDESQRRIDDTHAQIEAAARDLEISRQETAAAGQQIETLTRNLETARKELDTTRDDVEATLRDIETARRDIETARRDSDAARDEISRLSDVLRIRQERAEQARRLPEAVRALDEAATFGEVLGTLALRAGREAGRAAVFLVKGDRLRDWRTVGFEFASDAPRLDISFSDSGPMAEAVRSGEGVPPGSEHHVPEFARGEEAREAAAWPVSVGGSVVAVLYADGAGADKSDEPYWPAFLDVLARHAGRVLEGITVRQAAGLIADRTTGISPSSVSPQSTGSIQ